MALTAKKVYAILKRQISNMEAKLNSPVRYRGTVAIADLLPLNPDIGDMYNIESKSVYGEAGMNVAWNGVVWDTMGAPIDMSLYLTKEEAETVIQRLVTEYFEKNPVKPGATEEQAQQIEQNKTDIASLKAETGSLKEDIGNIVDDVNPLTWSDGFMLMNGKAIANKDRSVSDFCLCPAESQVEYVSETANQYVQGIVFYDKYKMPIIGYANNGKDGEPCIVTSPKDTYYLRLSIVTNNADKAYFKSSVPTVKSFIERNSYSLITAQDTDFAEIEVTNYMLICDIIKNKAYTVNNNTYSGLRDNENKDSSTLCILDKTKDMYAGNMYNVNVIFFDPDREFISSTNALYHGAKLAKEQYPSNAKYVAFTWEKNGVIADKMYVSTVDNGYQTGLPALKYGKTIKYKNQRPIINI